MQSLEDTESVRVGLAIRAQLSVNQGKENNGTAHYGGNR